MGSNYKFIFSKVFQKQWDSYGLDTQRFVNNKLKLIDLNPFRFNPHKGYERVFKVKLNIQNRYSRLMYAVFFPDERSITILGIFPRDRDYKDFERIFGYLRK